MISLIAAPQIRAAAGAAEQGVSGEQHIPHLQRNGALWCPGVGGPERQGEPTGMWSPSS